jgi:hypothetical protein
VESIAPSNRVHANVDQPANPILHQQIEKRVDGPTFIASCVDKWLGHWTIGQSSNLAVTSVGWKRFVNVVNEFVTGHAPKPPMRCDNIGLSSFVNAPVLLDAIGIQHNAILVVLGNETHRCEFVQFLE